jgi:protein SCO1/2
MRSALVSLALLVGLPAAVVAGPSLPPVLQKVGFDQRLGEQVPLELAFRDEAGRTVHLRDYFDDRPVILVLAYFKCPMLCTQVLNGLVQTMLDMPLHVGKDFTVLTVSFDPREGPKLAAAKKRTYLERLGEPDAEVGWHFLTGDEEAIGKLTRAVGFRYVYDQRHDQYAHASGIVVLTPEGQVSRYFYDVKYSPRDLRLGLVEASHRRVGSPVDRILPYCFHYDPNDGKYGPTIMNFIRLGGVLTVLSLGGFIIVLWWCTPRHPLARRASEGE